MSKIVKIKKWEVDETISRKWKRNVACDNDGYEKTEYMREENLTEDI